MSHSNPIPRLTRLRRWVALEKTSGALLMASAAIALVWANSPWRSGYTALSEVVIGPAVLHLDLSLAQWAADGLLAVFFFVVGVELKHEIVAGGLSRPREAAVPDSAKIATLLGTLLAAVLAAVTLRWDARKARRQDMNEDGVPDIDTELIGEDEQ